MGNAAGVVAPARVDQMTVNVSIAPSISIAGPSGQGSGVTIASAAGGAALGAMLGGPAGALVGAALGAAGGLRGQQMLGRQVISSGGGSGGPPRPTRALHHWLSEAELEAIAVSDGSTEETSCKICLRSQTTISLQPCGHACLCAPCLLQIKRAAPANALPACPICRETVQGCQRVFL